MDTLAAAQLVRRVLKTDLYPRQRKALEQAAPSLDKGNAARAAELIRGVFDSDVTDTQHRILSHVLRAIKEQPSEWFDRTLQEDPEFRAFYEERRGRM